MRSSYENFLRRLCQYRVYLNLTQEETGNKLGITQSQFSKMELGKVIVPNKALALLSAMGWDINFLFTGKKSHASVSELGILVDGEGQDYRKLLGIIALFLEQGIEKCADQVSLEARCEIEILKRRAEGGASESVLYEIRKIAGIAQIPMAEKLGVNIKKYRMLEKKQTAPDAELLLRIYEVTGCKPSLLLDNGHVEKMIIDELWGQLTLPVQKEILALAKQVDCFFKM
ncbi:hypothetical protein IMSAGC019_00948 [Lachnospiraceae bacterium]|nr:hypothetical protein IMSAGC019_00948 [Lachnospiraceae bacterium]